MNPSMSPVSALIVTSTSLPPVVASVVWVKFTMPSFWPSAPTVARLLRPKSVS